MKNLQQRDGEVTTRCARFALWSLLSVAAIAFPPAALSADITLTPPAGGGVTITNAAGNATRFRVADDGTFTVPGLLAAPGTITGLCIEIATGRVGTCVASTFTSVTAGTGLTGGTITTTGTIGLATTNLLPTTPCSTNQVPKWNGAAWACGTDSNSGGTVTSVGASTPLAP